MAAKTWDNSDADNDWEVAANWTPAGVPDDTSDVIFDGTSDTNCNMSAASVCRSLTMSAGYNSTVDSVTFTVEVGTDGVAGGDGDVSVDSGTLDLGSGKWTVWGHWDSHSGATARHNDNLIELAGTGKTEESDYAGRPRHVEISGTYTTATGSYQTGNMLVTGSWTVNGSSTVSGTVTLNGTKIDGTSTLTTTSAIILTAGTWSVANTHINSSAGILGPGTYTTNMKLSQSFQTVKRTVIYTAGLRTIVGDLTINANNSPQEWEFDFATNNPSWNVSGDVLFDDSRADATLTITKGTGTFKFNGGAQSFTDTTDLGVGNLGDVEHDGAGGTLQLLTNMDCDDFDGMAGTLDANGQTLDVAGAMDWAAGYVIADPNGSTFEVTGNFTANGQDISGAGGGWTLTVGGTAVASGAGDVAHSNAGGGTEIDASANPWTDSGNNTNWNFGAVGNPWHYYQQQTAGAA